MYVYAKSGGSSAATSFGVNLHLFLQCNNQSVQWKFSSGLWVSVECTITHSDYARINISSMNNLSINIVDESRQFSV